jgi:predicted Zn-dependent peptidase
MKFTKTILPNGLRLITAPMKDNLTVTVLAMVEAGSKYEIKENNGISHFIEHMCFKGTKKRPTAMDISLELDAIGAYYNAFTSHEFTGYYAKAQARHVSKIIDTVSDIYLNALFPLKEIEKERGVIVEEITMYEDLPHRHVQDLFMELLYGDQPAGWNIAGTRDVVRRLTRDDFIKYHEKNYVAGATTVVVSGHLDEAKVIEEVSQRFAAISGGDKHPKTNVMEKQTAPALLVKHKQIDQAHLVLGVRSFDTYHECQITLKVLEAILGGGMSSRFFQKLREEMGVGYYVRVNEDSYTDHGYFNVATGVDVKRVDEVIRAILTEFKRMTVEKVSDEELTKAKDYLTGTMLLGLESSDSIAEFLGYQEILRKSIRIPTEIIRKIREVTAEDIFQVSNLIFKDAGLNLALIGPFKDEEIFRPSLTLNNL